MSDSSKAVFLSYASQDAAAALRICEALRAAGVEVWFDQSELRGGDTWDHKIRKQIKECALFVPIISVNTNSRPEGYFRLEWKLAVDRSHLLADDHAFLFPVVVDDTAESTARVPEKFRDVQWTRLNVKDTPETLARRVGRLLDRDAPPDRDEPAASRTGRSRREKQPSWLRYAWMVVGLMFAVIYLVRPMWQSKRRSPEDISKVVAQARSLAEQAAKYSAPATPEAATPSEARQLAAKARELFNGLDSTKDDFALAEDMLKQAVAKAPGDAEVWATYAQLHQRYGARGWDNSNERREAAWTSTQRALRLDPHSYEARFAAAGFFTGTAKETQEHEPALRALLAERPDDKRVLRAIGGLLRFQPGHLDEAIQFYDRSAQLPGGDPLALYNKALALWFVGRTREAQEALAASLAQQRFLGSRLMNAYFALSLTGDLDRAQSLLTELPASIFLEDRGCYFAYLVYRYRNEPDRALAFVQALSREWLNDNWFRGPRGLLAGNALAQAGSLEAAAVEWRTALKVVDQRLAANPNDLVALGNRAILLGSLGDVTAARQLLPTLRQMLQVDKPTVIAPTWFTQACLLAGEKAEAMHHIEVALKTKLHASYYTVSDLRHDPSYAPLRGDPEFNRLIAVAERAERTDFGESAPGAAVSAGIVDEKSVAVLAFANLSEDKGNEYFSDGISEELLNVLAKIPGLKVSARTSAFYFKNKDVAVGEIGRQLGVAYVIEGSVRKAGDKVRITAELVKAADGFQVWSDTFTRDVKDIFAVQDEIAGLVARNLQLKLGATARATPSVDPEAYRLYLEGRQILQRRTNESYTQAEKLFEQARAIAPAWAPIYAGLADAARLRAFGPQVGPKGPADQWTPAMQQAKALADRALELDPALADAYVSLAGTNMLAWNFPETERLIHRALELNPNQADAYLVLGRVMSAEGRMDECITALRRAVDLNPLAPRILDNLAAELGFIGRYGEAWEIIERANALQPDSSQIQCYRVRLLADLGRREEALALARRMTENSNPEEREFRLIEAARVYALYGMKAEAEAAARQVPANMPEHVIGLAYLGEPRKAVALLDLLTFGWIEDLLWGRSFDAIRHDPDYEAYLARTGLTESNSRAQAWRAAHPPAKS